ncbi:MAG: hypothetical protein JW776_02620 [Candidatus Lokiarchaeota archaeon]|nr:hypothetical protein [Candidatus Lokiarchaeota archaeon]
MRKKLKITDNTLQTLNDFILDPDNRLINDLLQVVQEYGGADEINQRASKARKMENLMEKLEEINSTYVNDVKWLQNQEETHQFIRATDFQKNILGEDYSSSDFNDDLAVTLELSAIQYFPFFIDMTKRAIKHQKLMPGRVIRVRNMKEQERDGDLVAMAAAMQIIGASYVETLDTKGTAPGPDGLPVNIHLGGAETITGYFGGVGQPNDYAIKWIKEFLYYYTNYGVKQVLNVNPGTVLLGYFLHKIGIDNEFKISVYMGNDNPYSCLWTLLTAKLFAREDGTTPLIGFNLSNAVNNETIEFAARIRNQFGFKDVVRLEHHVTETIKNIVRQPYDRRDELIELAKKVTNVSAKHEGGDPEIDRRRKHPTDILDYFLSKEKIHEMGIWDDLRQNHLDRLDAINTTAKLLTENKLSFLAAKNLHYY